MLTDPMRKYLENPHEYKKRVQAVYNRRLRKYAVQAIKDLAFLTEKLSEKEQAKIFSVENMKPLLRMLFSLQSDDIENEKRRKRVIGLWHALFSGINGTYGLKLVSKEVWQVLASQPIPHIQAIYYATLFR